MFNQSVLQYLGITVSVCAHSGNQYTATIYNPKQVLREEAAYNFPDSEVK